MFKIYLELGFDHILDINGYDHILFIIALCAVYLISDWKRVLILVTAFTIGHSLTLALASLEIISFSEKVIEFLIPVTILATAIYNVTNTNQSRRGVNINYLLALIFGLIHGLGFSNYFRALLGKEESIIAPLFAFNVGVEFGQIIIVIITLILSYVLVSRFKVKHRDWNLFVSGAAAGLSLMMIIDSI